MNASIYGLNGPFASSSNLGALSTEAVGHIWSFFAPKDLARIESICQNWNRFIHATEQWKRQCQIQLGISSKTDPKLYLPESSSYKKSLQLIFSKILDGDFYKSYLGVNIGPIPRIPEEISLRKWNESDPCDPTKKIGQEYVWMYVPSQIEISNEDFFLDKPDDPMNPEAPKLIRRKPIACNDKLIKKTLKASIPAPIERRPKQTDSKPLKSKKKSRSILT